MVVAQKVKEAEITEQDSLLLTRNLLRIAIFNISYIRGLFPEKYFNDKSVPALEMKIKKLMPVDAESRRLIDWMEKGVYDALQKKYLKTLLFCICETIEGPMIEEYAFSFSYSNGDSQEISMDINRSGNKKQGGTFKCNSMKEVTPSQMKSSACKMIRTLVQLMRTLDKMPEERTILMKLLYYDDVTPSDYEPPFFKGCIDDNSSHWTKNPLKMEVGNVNSKHLILALKVKSVLDPCEDEDEENLDESANLAADSVEKGGSPTSSSEMNSSQEDQYVGSPVDKLQPNQDDTAMSHGSDETQNPAEDEHQLSCVRSWIDSGKFGTVELIDAMAKFPDISAVLIEEIMGKLVGEGLLSKCGIENYVVNRPKSFEYEFDVKEEPNERSPQNGDRIVPDSGEDYMYMKALYHALPMEYVTISKLQSKLEGEANYTTVRKLIEKMAREGFLEATSSRKLGKRVIRSELTERRLHEVKKALDFESMDVDVKGNQPQIKSNQSESEKSGGKRADISTCGVLHSIGSDLTRMRVRSESEMLQDGTTRTDPSLSRKRESPDTPMSKAGGPVPSRESTMLGNGKSRSNELSLSCNEVDDVICSRVSHDKRSRKASTVEDPIIQYYKRQKSQSVA